MPAKTTELTCQARANNVRTPTTRVFSPICSSNAVIAALTNGRVKVSSRSYGPHVEFYGDSDADGTRDMVITDNAKTSGNRVMFCVQPSGAIPPNGVCTVTVVHKGATG